MKTKEAFRKLNLNNAFMFALAMNAPVICRKVLEIILGEPVGRIQVHSEQSLLYHSDFRSVRLDVYAQSDMRVDYNVEMENRKEYLPKRSRYYQAQMDVASLKPGEDFDDMKPSYVIFICTFDPFSQQLYRYSFENICHETGQSLEDGTKKIFLNTKGSNTSDVPLELIHFLQYVENSTDECVNAMNDPILSDIHRKVTTLKASHEWEAKYMKFEELLKAERMDGERRGERRGEQRGEQKGEQRLARLIHELICCGRESDIPRVTDDPVLRQQLYQEFHLN